MEKSLLFIPDISGFTEFVQTTEVEHSQHVISELLEILLKSNTIDMQLAEVEGDALFFYKEEEVPSLEMLLAQIETMFTAFYSHLKLLEKNRICPCNACSSAPKLQLKIVAHCGALQFITVQDKRKPFGTQVIEAHRLLKNSVNSDNYVLLSQSLVDVTGLKRNYSSKIYDFKEGTNSYDGKTLDYLYSDINRSELKLRPFSQAKKININRAPNLHIEKKFPIAAKSLFEYITNYSYRHNWVEGEIKFEYDADEVTRIGSEHVCIINETHLNFTAVIKNVNPGQLVYGELTTDPPPVDELYQFYIITPINSSSCKLEVEVYWKAVSPIKKLMLLLVVKRILQKNLTASLENLFKFVKGNTESV